MSTDRLDADTIRRALPSAVAGRTAEILVYDQCASTNAELLDRGAAAAGTIRVAIANAQTAGRGRRGRRWISQPGAGLWFSFGYRFEKTPMDLTTLSLVTGLCVHSCVHTYVPGVGLKWPNDIVVDDRKLGGILVELRTGPGGSLNAVAGIGLNLRIPVGICFKDGLEPIGMSELVVDPPPRNTLAAKLIETLLAAFDTFANAGFAPFSDAWHAADVLAGRAIVLASDGGRFDGVARGIDAEGSLLIERAGIVAAYKSGDISVRPT